jgi:hypothetical protein
MADYTNRNRAFTDALYGQRISADSTNNGLSALGDPPPLNDSPRSDGRGGFFSLSAINNSMELLSSSNHHTFADDPVIGLLYNLIPAASGAHTMTHHLEDPVTGGGVAGVNKHAAATIKFSGRYFNGAEHEKHKKLALVTKKGNTIFYTIDKHEIGNNKHTFTATGSAGSDFGAVAPGGEGGPVGTAGNPAIGDNMRRLVQLGYR